MDTSATERQLKKDRLKSFYALDCESTAGATPLNPFDNVVAPNNSTDPCNLDGTAFDTAAYMRRLLEKNDLSDLLAKETEIIEQIRSLDSEMQTLVYENYNRFILATDTIKMKEMNSLSSKMQDLTSSSNDIKNLLGANRDEMRKLAQNQRSLQRVQYLFTLPQNLKDCIVKKDWLAAVHHHEKALETLTQFERVPAFENLIQECSTQIDNLHQSIWQSLEDSTEVSELEELVGVAQLLGVSFDRLYHIYIKTLVPPGAHLIAMLSVSLHFEGFMSASGQALEEESFMEKLDQEIFTNLRERCQFFFNCFIKLDKLQMEKNDCEILKAWINLLAKVLKGTDDLVNAYVAESVIPPEKGVPSLVNTLRMYYTNGNRLLDWLRVELPERLAEANQLVAEFVDGDARDQLLTTVLNSARRQAHWDSTQLREFTAAKLGTLSQSLAAANYDPGQLNDLYQTLSKELASNLRDRLVALGAFVTGESVFVASPSFHVEFCVDVCRDEVLIRYLQYLADLCRDLVQLGEAQIPVEVYLVLGRLANDWAESGTLGHLLKVVDDLLLPKEATSFGAHDQNKRKMVNQLVAKRPKPLTMVGPLAQRFRETSAALLSCVVRLRGEHMALMLQKSVDSRDWLNCLEPRSVRSVIQRVVQDLRSLDATLSQILPSQPSAASSSKDAHNPFGRVGAKIADDFEVHNDSHLASQLRNLFTKRVEIFSTITPHRQSVLLGVMKVALKSLVECVRLKVFGKNGLQQIQLDCAYFRYHVGYFVSDMSIPNILIEDIVYSVVQRCVDPVLLDDSVISTMVKR